MNSLRLLGRAVPKSASFRPISSRCYSIASRASPRPSWQPVKKLTFPSFSTSIARREPAGDNDQVLAEKFQSEYELERQTSDPESEPAEIENFKAKGIWEITGRPGTNEIILKREFGNETIKVEVSVLSMFDYNDSAAEELFDEEEDSALGDEDFYDQPKRTINQSGARGGAIDVAPEDSIAPADREGEAADEAPRPSYPIDLDITIAKPDKTSIELVARATDGTIEIERLRYVSDPPADDDHTTPYAGPPFTNLDSDLSVMLEQYIAERGINEELAQMLPVIIEHKEQKEYVEWLQNMQKFISA